MADRDDYQRQMRELRAVDKPKPVRLSLSDILALMLTRGGGERDSIELTRNAKGETQIAVTVRTTETRDLLEAESEAKDVYNRLRATYPLSSGYVGADGGK
jgi:hypothetical protein